MNDDARGAGVVSRHRDLGNARDDGFDPYTSAAERPAAAAVGPAQSRAALSNCAFERGTAVIR